jgi:hypothetical protein
MKLLIVASSFKILKHEILIIRLGGSINKKWHIINYLYTSINFATYLDPAPHHTAISTFIVHLCVNYCALNEVYSLNILLNNWSMYYIVCLRCFMYIVILQIIKINFHLCVLLCYYMQFFIGVRRNTTICIPNRTDKIHFKMNHRPNN